MEPDRGAVRSRVPYRARRAADLAPGDLRGRRASRRRRAPAERGRPGGPGRILDAAGAGRGHSGSDRELASASRPWSRAFAGVERPERGRVGRRMPRIHPQADDRLESRGDLDFRAPRRGTGAAPRAAGDLPADDGNLDPLEEHRPHGRRPDSLPARRDGHRAPRRHHRPALDELAHLAQRAQDPRARDHRAARRADHLRPVPPDARFLAPRRRDDGPVER